MSCALAHVSRGGVNCYNAPGNRFSKMYGEL